MLLLLRDWEGLAEGHRGSSLVGGRGVSGHGLRTRWIETRCGDSLCGEFRYLF